MQKLIDCQMMVNTEMVYSPVMNKINYVNMNICSGATCVEYSVYGHIFNL